MHKTHGHTPTHTPTHRHIHTSWKEFVPTRSSLAGTVGSLSCVASYCTKTGLKIDMLRNAEKVLTWINPSVIHCRINHITAWENNTASYIHPLHPATVHSLPFKVHWLGLWNRFQSHITLKVCTQYAVFEMSCSLKQTLILIGWHSECHWKISDILCLCLVAGWPRKFELSQNSAIIEKLLVELHTSKYLQSAAVDGKGSKTHKAMI